MVEASVACPCADAHRRLMDLHEDIHRAVGNYLDPNEFRRFLNSAIQDSRAVTFLLQKRKSKWADFDTWYGAWQEAAKLNVVLAWGVTSRNRVVKEEDLNTLSEARISFYGDRLLEAEDAFLVPPAFTVDMIIAAFAESSRRKPANRTGKILVQRRWIDDQLPAYELVAALRELYRAVAKVVATAHDQSSVSSCGIQPFSRGCVTAEIDPGLPCLPPGDALTNKIVDLATGAISTYGYVNVDIDEELAKVGVKKYGAIPGFSIDPIEHAMERLKLSKQFLEADGYSGPSLVFLNSVVRDLRVHALVFLDDEPRELKIQAAVQGCGAWQYDGAVFSTETWIGTVGDGGQMVDVPKDERKKSTAEFFNADPVGDREEALVVYGLRSDHHSRTLILPFARTSKGIVYGSLIDDESGSMIPDLLRPIWRRWPDH